MDGSKNVPKMNWQAPGLDREFARFKDHCNYAFGGPLSGKTEVQKVNYLMTFIGDRGRELFLTFTLAPAAGNNPPENETLAGVYAKYEAHVKPRHEIIWATVRFNKRKQLPSERFDDFVTELKILVRGCDYGTMENRMVRDAIVLRLKHPEVQGKCFEKGDDLTMEMAIKVGQDDESSRESLSAIGCGEDTKIHGTGYQKYKTKRKTQELWSDKASSKSSYKKRKDKKRGDKDQYRRCGYEKNISHAQHKERHARSVRE